MTKVASVRLRELLLYHSDLPAQLHFYTEVLGLTLSHPAEPEQFTVQTGRSQLTFAQAKEGENGRYHFAFNIPPTQFAEARQWLTGRVPLIHDEQGADEFHFRSWNAHACYFFDPVGQVVAGDEFDDVPGRVKK